MTRRGRADRQKRRRSAQLPDEAGREALPTRLASSPPLGPSTDTGRSDDLEEIEIRAIQPHQATKTYLCPGCHGDIAVGVGHLVIVPVDEPDLRRHWHRPCWHNRSTRRPGRIR